MTQLPEKLRQLQVAIGDHAQAGQLLKGSTYEFRYLDADPSQMSVALRRARRARLVATGCWRTKSALAATCCAYNDNGILHLLRRFKRYSANSCCFCWKFIALVYSAYRWNLYNLGSNSINFNSRYIYVLCESSES